LAQIKDWNLKSMRIILYAKACVNATLMVNKIRGWLQRQKRRR
jgi:hypothetical protein